MYLGMFLGYLAKAEKSDRGIQVLLHGAMFDVVVRIFEVN